MAPMPLQVTACPACALPAEVVARRVLESTDGPVEHARVQCIDHHVFNLPVAMLDISELQRPPGRRGVDRDRATPGR